MRYSWRENYVVYAECFKTSFEFGIIYLERILLRCLPKNWILFKPLRKGFFEGILNLEKKKFCKELAKYKLIWN